MILEEVATHGHPDGLTSREELEIARLKDAKNQAYWERNRLVYLLACMFPSGTGRTDIEGWGPEWHNCVYIDLPTGQVSWHIHDSELEAFELIIMPYKGYWDGHTTEQKYQRLAAVGDKFLSSALEVAIPLDHPDAMNAQSHLPARPE